MQRERQTDLQKLIITGTIIVYQRQNREFFREKGHVVKVKKSQIIDSVIQWDPFFNRATRFV